MKTSEWLVSFNQAAESMEKQISLFQQFVYSDIAEARKNSSFELIPFITALSANDSFLLYRNEVPFLKFVISLTKNEDFSLSETEKKVLWDNILSILSSSTMQEWLDRAGMEDDIEELVTKALGAVATVDLSSQGVEIGKICNFYNGFVERNADYYENVYQTIMSAFNVREDGEANCLMSLIKDI